MKRTALLGMGFLSTLPCFFTPALGQQSAPDRVTVDLELVLAADTSESMDGEERNLQVQGYANAFRDPKVVAAILSGPLGRIAVTYVEWSDEQRVIVPWTLIENRADAESFGSAIARALIYQHFDGTNISGALAFGAGSLRENRFDGTRLVIDISGDGENNSPTAPDGVRDAIVKQGITINGLPLDIPEDELLDRRSGPTDIYYRDHVIGGEDAFLLTAQGINEFAKSVKLKLVREIAFRG